MTISQLKQTALNMNEARIVNAITDQQETIDALTGEIVESVVLSRNSNDGVFVQLQKENGETITSQSLGIEVWETLDLNNLPTNFAVGQEIMITLLTTVDESNPTNWTTAIGSVPTASEKTAKTVFRFQFAEGEVNANFITSIDAGQNAFSGLELVVENVTNWNDTGGTLLMGQLVPFAFNGAGIQLGTNTSISRGNVATVVESIKRKL